MVVRQHATIESLEAEIARAVARLGRFGASYPLYLRRPPDHEVVSARDLLNPDRLREFSERAILEWTAHPEDEDIRAAASRLMRRYCGSMSLASLLPLAHGFALDVSLDRSEFLIRTDLPMGVVLDIDGADIVSTPERPGHWPLAARSVPSEAQLRERALTSLFRDNLAPAFRLVLEQIRVSARLLWSTAAEQIDFFYESAAQDKTISARLVADREAILFGSELPGVEGLNPMRDLLYWETSADPTFERPLQVRRVCCVNYVVPGRPNKWCRTCGLITPGERLELWQRFRASLTG